MKQKKRTRITKEFLTNYFCLHKEHDLIEKISTGSKTAETQLLVQYMPHLLEIVEDLATHFNGKHEAMEHVMEAFCKGLKTLAHNYYCKNQINQDFQDEWNTHLMEVYLKKIKKHALFDIRSNKEILHSLTYSRNQISRLNKLNEILKIRQAKIWEILTESLLKDYPLTVSVDYHLLESAFPIHRQRFSTSQWEMKGLSERLNSKEFDWWADGMPVLDNYYCYLLSEIFEQWLILHRIPDIGLICTSIQVDKQNSILMKNGQWVFI